MKNPLGSITYAWGSEGGVPSATASNPAMVNLAAPLQTRAFQIATSVYRGAVFGDAMPTGPETMPYNGETFALDPGTFQSNGGNWPSVAVDISQVVADGPVAKPNVDTQLVHGALYFLSSSSGAQTMGAMTGSNPFWLNPVLKSSGNTSVVTARWNGVSGASAASVAPAGVLVTLAQEHLLTPTPPRPQKWVPYHGTVPAGLGAAPIKHDGRWVMRHGDHVLAHGFAGPQMGSGPLSDAANALLTALSNAGASNVNNPGQTACSDSTIFPLVTAFQTVFNTKTATVPSLGGSIPVTSTYDAATQDALNKTIVAYGALTPPVTFITTAAPVPCTGPTAAQAAAAAASATGGGGGTTSTGGTTVPILPPATTTAAPGTITFPGIAPVISAPAATPAAAPNYTPIVVTGVVLGLGALAYFAFKGKGK